MCELQAFNQLFSKIDYPIIQEFFLILFTANYSKNYSSITYTHTYLSGLKIPYYYVQSTRSYHPLYYSLPLSNSNPYKFSFFPRTIVDWNVLPHHLIELQSIDLFVVGVCMHLSI